MSEEQSARRRGVLCVSYSIHLHTKDQVEEIKDRLEKQFQPVADDLGLSLAIIPEGVSVSISQFY